MERVSRESARGFLAACVFEPTKVTNETFYLFLARAFFFSSSFSKRQAVL